MNSLKYKKTLIAIDEIKRIPLIENFPMLYNDMKIIIETKDVLFVNSDIPTVQITIRNNRIVLLKLFVSLNAYWFFKSLREICDPSGKSRIKSGDFSDTFTI